MTVAAVRLAELLGGLSLAQDIVSGFAHGKVVRTSVLAVELGKAAGLGHETLRDAFFITLLRYMGCTGFAHEESHVYGAGDDITVRNVMAMADIADPVRTGGAILKSIGSGASLPERALAIARLLGDSSAMERHARAQCDTSVQLASLAGVSDSIVSALSQICERWDGRGVPNRAEGEELALAMRVHHIADVTEIAHHRGGREFAVQVAQRRTGGHFDPQLTPTFLADSSRIFEAIEAPELWQRFLDSEPEPRVWIGAARVDEVTRAFSHFADLKSIFTLGHSANVSKLAESAGVQMGLDDQALCDIRRAGYLHDLGRLSVSNRIWDHPGKLSDATWEQVRLHAYYTERILSRVPALSKVSEIAAAAHEKLDGSGYHRSLPASLVNTSARLLAVADAAQAMLEPRPYRPVQSIQYVEHELAHEAKQNKFDPNAVDAVLCALGVRSRARPANPAGLTDREVEVLCLLARGKTNKEIGQLLQISARTVQNHVAHIYDKLGVYSRAGAAVFAMESGLF